MRAIMVRASLLAMVVFAGAGSALGQTNADLKARCDQLIAYYDYYGSSRGEHTDGAKNWTRIDAGIDCDKGTYQAGIKAMEGLLTAKGFSIPQPNVASTPDGQVGPINTAQMTPDQTEHRQQSSALNDDAYCATLSETYRKTAPQHHDPSVTVPTAMAQCQAGNTADGIPVLEQALRNGGMTVPQRTQ